MNYEYMKEYLVRTNAAEDVRALSKLDMARAMNLVDFSEYGGYRAKNFAVLMFADHPENFIPYAYVEVIREVSGTDKMESKSFKGPVWIQAQQIRDYFESAIMASYTIREADKSGARRIFNWPQAMFEELSTNCILHKEYSRKQYVGIYVYKDHLSFINHNRPVPPVTIADLNDRDVFDDRQYLNDELKDMFFKLDLIQSYGSGIRRAKKAMKDNGSPALVYGPENDTDDYTQVIAYINPEFANIQDQEKLKNGEIAQESAQEITQESAQENIGANDLENKIIAIMKEMPTITRRELAQKLGISPDNVKYRIRKLNEAGIIEHEGSTKSGKWVVHD